MHNEVSRYQFDTDIRLNGYDNKGSKEVGLSCYVEFTQEILLFAVDITAT